MSAAPAGDGRLSEDSIELLRQAKELDERWLDPSQRAEDAAATWGELQKCLEAIWQRYRLGEPILS